MENINNLNDIFFEGGLINLKSTSIENLEKKLQEIEIKQKDIKDSIFSVIDGF